MESAISIERHAPQSIILFSAILIFPISLAGYGHDNYGHDSGYGGGYHDDGYGHEHEHHGYGYHTTKRGKSKLGLLALLPLLAIPALAALGIPAIAALAGAGTALVPVTATLGTFVANPGRKKREAIYRTVRDFLSTSCAPEC